MSSTNPSGTTTINPDDVVKAWRADPLQAGVPEQQLAALEPYVRKLPEILAADLDKQVTIELLARAILAYCEYIVANADIIKTVLDAIDDELGDAVIEFLDELIEMFEEQLPNLPAAIAASGQSEQELLIAGPPALNDEATALLRAGELTLGRLLVVQPGVLTIERTSGSSHSRMRDRRRRRH